MKDNPLLLLWALNYTHREKLQRKRSARRSKEFDLIRHVAEFLGKKQLWRVEKEMQHIP